MNFGKLNHLFIFFFRKLKNPVLFLVLGHAESDHRHKKERGTSFRRMRSRGGGEMKERERDQEDFPISHVCASVTCNHTSSLPKGQKTPTPSGGDPSNGPLYST
jgi:hypothetical protein